MKLKTKEKRTRVTDPGLRNWVMPMAFLALNQITLSSQAAQLPLDAYLQKVKATNSSYLASQKAAEGAAQSASESTLLTTPNLFVNVSQMSDERVPSQPSFQGTKTAAQNYSVGVSQATTFGLAGKFYYSYSDIKIDGATLLPQPAYKTGAPTIELNQSLWKNGFGSELKASKALIDSSNMGNKYLELFKAEAKLVEAELTYWRLSLARETVQIQKSILDRSAKILDWSRKRAKMNLGDKSDALQSEAGYRFRELEVQNAVDDERAAAKSFNLLIESESEKVSETVEIIDPKLILNLKLPEKTPARNDLKSSQYFSKVQELNALLAQERNNPTFDVFLTYSWNSRENQASDAFSKSFNSTNPYSVIGLKFQTPLDFSARQNVISGKKLESEAARVGYERKKFELEQEWTDLKIKFSEAQRKLGLAMNLEKLQREKLDYERDRFLRGRSTTFQVLTFEQDYAQAQMNRLRAEFEVIKQYTQSKLFEDKSQTIGGAN
jgi:hypothetical protein